MHTLVADPTYVGTDNEEWIEEIIGSTCVLLYVSICTILRTKKLQYEEINQILRFDCTSFWK